MLIILSDLHLTDGSVLPTTSAGAFHLLADRLRELAARASWRADGSYRPIDRIDLVLLGDTLDLTRTARWLKSDVRPWDAVSPRLTETVAAIVDETLRHNAEALASLRSLASAGAVVVAPSGPSGEPIFGGEPLPVTVRTHYVVGNCDWLLHLRGESFDLIRQKVAHHMGLANPHNQPFPHDPSESDELLAALRRHRVFARHGDVFDPLSFFEQRDASSLSETVAIQLLSRFLGEVRRLFGDDLPEPLAHGLHQVHFVRPVLLAPVWIDGVLERMCPTGVRQVFRQTWDKLADELLQLAHVRQQAASSPFPLLDGLERSLKFSKRLSLGWAAKIGEWLNGLRGATNDSLVQHAVTEQEFRNRRARQIVYGHTHAAESVPLDASYADGYVLNQMYFNAGTWRRVYRPTLWSPGQQEFVPAESLSLLSFYQADERSGRSFETWTGTLGTGAIDAVPRAPGHASKQSVPASNANLRAPHFDAALAANRVAASRY